jgi:hypothetical protein
MCLYTWRNGYVILQAWYPVRVGVHETILFTPIVLFLLITVHSRARGANHGIFVPCAVFH